MRPAALIKELIVRLAAIIKEHHQGMSHFQSDISLKISLAMVPFSFYKFYQQLPRK